MSHATTLQRLLPPLLLKSKPHPTFHPSIPCPPTVCRNSSTNITITNSATSTQMLKMNRATTLQLLKSKPHPTFPPSIPRSPTIRQNSSTTHPPSIPRPPTVRQNSPTTSPSSIYLHLPFCRRRCHYCDFPIISLGSSSPNPDNHPLISSYIHLLLREILATQSHPSPLKTIFLGGGTPSLVPPRLISSLLTTIRAKFGEFAPNIEISLEMDPGTFDAERLKEMVGDVGVTRVSLGVQAFQEDLLRECGRAHGRREVEEAIGLVGGLDGIKSWSLDLISSLPGQTREMWEESLRLAVAARPQHVSVYDLQVERGTKFAKL